MIGSTGGGMRMDEQKFFKLGLAAKSLLEKAADESERSFWEGYRKGLRRNYHWDRIGPDEEHSLWMGFAAEKDNLSKRLCGIGYRAGFEEMDIPEAIEYLKGVMQPH